MPVDYFGVIAAQAGQIDGGAKAGRAPTGRERARVLILAFVLAGLVLSAVAASALAAAAPVRPGVVLVGFGAMTSASERSALERAVGVTRVRALGTAAHSTTAGRRLERRLGLAFALSVSPGREMADVAWLRRQRRLVRYAEPDYLLEASAARVPDDPSFSLQWGSLNTGQSVNGVTGAAGADDGAAKAWSVTTGSPSIVIAEVDTGVDYTHPDLAANVWTNPGGVGRCPAGTHGYNVVAGTCDPMDGDTAYNGHGTHVAGIIGAVGDNGTGVAGMNWRTTILPLKWLNDNAASPNGTSGTTSQLISALDWVASAKNAGVNVRVVNDSATFVGTAYSQALSDEIDLIGSEGILFVTAAGNTSQDNDNPSTPRYPCNYDRPTELCVTATDQNDALPSWANWGASRVDLAAPGDKTYSTLRVAAGSYGYISGSSMSAAQVSGAAGLILSAANLSTTALKADILGNVDRLASLSGKVRTGGRLDVCKAIPGCEPPTNTGTPSVGGSAVVGQTLSASEGSWSADAQSFAYQWQRCNASGGVCKAITGAIAPTYQVAPSDQGFTLRAGVTASDAGGSSSPAYSPVTRVVVAPPPPSSPGQTPTASGPAPPVAVPVSSSAPLPGTAPVARAFAVTPRRMVVSIDRTGQSTKGIGFRFWLNEPASVWIVIERRLAGWRVRGRCVAAGHAPVRATPCTLYVKLATIEIGGARQGSNSETWRGRVRGRLLARGSYRALLVAGIRGKSSASEAASFVVVDVFATPPRTGASTRRHVAGLTIAHK